MAVASLAIARLNALTDDFVLFGGRRAGTGVSAIRAWGIDLPSVVGSIAGVVEITSGSGKFTDRGLASFDALKGSLRWRVEVCTLRDQD